MSVAICGLKTPDVASLIRTALAPGLRFSNFNKFDSASCTKFVVDALEFKANA